MHRNITNAVSTALHFLIDLVFAFLFCIFMTELTKVFVGRLRWLAAPAALRMPRSSSQPVRTMEEMESNRQVETY